ncbi:hypothetical protein ACRXCV_00180 (plasmid) [Halobacteriovorax sp. GFR7]|uniref:hypothetical protein n=1 Tax=unclassified Halobacteriovorax TaxID=2639665 RepID=UPI003D9958A9
MYDYKYINQANPFAYVLFTLDGDFTCVECDPTEAELADMANIVDVEGWTMESL